MAGDGATAEMSVETGMTEAETALFVEVKEALLKLGLSPKAAEGLAKALPGFCPRSEWVARMRQKMGLV